MQRDLSKKVSNSMVKSLTSFGIFALLGASIIALPGFAPKVEASDTFALAKGDRLHVRSPAVDCSQQTWPHLASSCLRSSDRGAPTLVARLVPARR